MRFFLFVKLFRESYLFAFNAIIVNKLRTILSLLGITIGIFSIISVFTVFDSLRSKINNSLQSLGNNTVYIQKWPWAFGSDYPWWKYMNRPVPTIDDLNEIQRRSSTVKNAAFIASTSKTVKFRDNSVENAAILGVSSEYDKVWNVNIEEGRYFTEAESNEGRNVAIIGSDLVLNLFNNQSPLDKEIKVLGRKFNVIGDLTKVGNDMFSKDADKYVIIPVNCLRKIVNLNSDCYNPFVSVSVKDGISIDQMKDELKGILRSVRRLKPGADDNFSLNETSMLLKGFESLFGIIGIAGWIIGGFSILVGGFGIANIMFVSVKERTNIIGIQKSLGAKRYFILFQFLFEAVFLSLFGGLLGLVLVYTGTLIANNFIDFKFVLSMGNIFMGLWVSALIGFISGMVPALIASRLNPVDAIRSN